MAILHRLKPRKCLSAGLGAAQKAAVFGECRRDKKIIVAIT
jgi:hypothetical protein